eukprot:616708-Rhodomonas_salina.1
MHAAQRLLFHGCSAKLWKRPLRGELMLSPAKVGRYAFLGFDCCRVWEELARALRRACRSGEILWCVSANPSFSGMHASEGAISESTARVTEAEDDQTVKGELRGTG